MDQSGFEPEAYGYCGKTHQKLHHAFTEHGTLMAANVLNSTRAVTMSLYIIRAFVRLREVLRLVNSPN